MSFRQPFIPVKRAAAAAVLLAAFAGAAIEAQAPKPSIPGRYSMAPTDGGFLRLDTETGAVSFCTKRSEQWVCNTVEDNRGAALRELERLAQENRDLKAELAELRRLETKSSKVELPSEEEVDKAVSLMKRIIKEFKGLMEDETTPKNKL